MNCNECGRKTAKDWNYCPYCGEEVIRSKGIFGSIDKIFKGLFNNLNKGLINEEVNGNKFTIRIRGMPNNNTNFKPRPQKQSFKMPAELIEPEAKIKRLGNELEINVLLPGIKSLNEIRLVKMGESLEIRAVNGNKGYFKLISVPNEYQVINKTINNELLNVRMREA